MIHSVLKRAFPIQLAFATGCTTMGTGIGSSATGATKVNFNWKSADSVSGTMKAVLNNGKTYSGLLLAGGGQGQRQVPDGKTIDATFPVA